MHGESINTLSDKYLYYSQESERDCGGDDAGARHMATNAAPGDEIAEARDVHERLWD